MIDKTLLEKNAEKIFLNMSGWETHTLEKIGKRIKQYKKLDLEALRSINNMAVVEQDMQKIIMELATVTGENIKDLQKMYADVLDEEHLTNKPLYDYRNVPFVPLSENKRMQAIIGAYAKTTGASFVNFAKVNALGFSLPDGTFKSMDSAYLSILDKAVYSLTTGATDFDSAMRSAVADLGGSGIKINYGNGITRSIDTAVRQAMLWGSKQATTEYSEMIAEELDCDGIEIDYHSSPRPTHEFMQGKQYALGEAKTIKGVYYESADEALARLGDYGCLHFKTPIILGVSEPTYSAEELNKLKAEDSKQIEYAEKKKTKYEWSQDLRKLETAGRKEALKARTFKASGDVNGENQAKAKLKAIREKYSDICKGTGIGADWSRFRISASNDIEIVPKAKENFVREKTKFEPAKTITEAEKKVVQFVDASGFGSMGVSYKGIELDSANEINEAIISFYEEYESDKLGGIIAPAGNTKMGMRIQGATAAFSSITRNLLLNRSSLKNLKVAKKAFEAEKQAIYNLLNHPEKYYMDRFSKKMLETIEHSRKTGRSVVAENIKETIYHELGHSLEKKIHEHPLWEKAKKNKEIFQDEISGYASVNESEYIAESFASYQKKENRIDPIMETIFKSLRRKQK